MAENYLLFVSALGIVLPICTMAAHEKGIAPAYETRAVLQHRTDSLTILMLLGLLLMTILTVWLFKHRRFRFVHETGLSLIYGLIVGAIIRYTSTATHPPRVNATLTANESYYSMDPPDILSVYLNRSNTSTGPPDTIVYVFKGTVIAPLQEPPLERAVTFSPELFFNVMLPVIIFEAGYSMKKRHFFKNLGAILTYALIGTTISTLVVGGIMYGLTGLMSNISISLNDCFVFGAIISATDPVTVLALFADLHVDVDLYALVFGESVLNDAVAIVLSESVETYGEYSTDAFSVEAFFQSVGKFAGVFAGAFAIGSSMGVLTAFLTKFTKVQDFPLLETALFFVMSYSTFQAAEAADFTGIVAVLFCGITQAHYTYNNLSTESKHRTKQLFELMNFLSENFVFLYIGVSIFTFERHKWHAGFIFSAFLAIIVARFFNVYPLSFLLNLGRSNKIRPNFQHMMMFSGLRGAIAFALAIRQTDTDSRQVMASTTMIIVLATVILCGGFTTPMLQWLQIRVGVEDNDTELHNMAGDSVRNAMSSQRQYSTMSERGPARHTVGSPPPPATSAHRLPTTTTSAPTTPHDPAAPSSRPSEKAWLVAKWYNFDTRFMKPLLTNSRPTLIDTMPKCCLPIAKAFTTEVQLSQGETHVDEDSDTDMILDQQSLSIGGGDLNNSALSLSGGGAQGGEDRPVFTSLQTVMTQPMQASEDSHVGDLGLGLSDPEHLTSFPMRVNLPGPRGDRV
ncbi:sodium/hydrogen exchanger 9 [Aplysia californica]|uniref:Sodium/hydrogen exchanger n=1 Tax=Aplysia californica TaxID=6500 RepID=A0ABM1A7D1_APLCA|nr:sodium/hydrogen exchanger 9 [Aplysia californica]